MSGDVVAGSTRPRPLSGGFWTLLSWLRGEERSASSDSLSSAGSDRTTVSFAFLPPAHYRVGAAPLVLPPPGPPTDSYKKRVRERNLRRQYDRDTTLHRKYGLFRGEGGVSFDAHSLPPARRTATGTDRKDRERRATSECLQRRAAHVPGKRRAPPPPASLTGLEPAPPPPASLTGLEPAPPPPASLTGLEPAPPPPASLTGLEPAPAAPPASINRRLTRKRPAPKPPTQTDKSKEVNLLCENNNRIEMSTPSVPDAQPLSSMAMGCKPEKCTKKDANSKNGKSRSEKSFLKQMFENKKRNSAVDMSAIKILPSISELDKQAAEIIENSRKNGTTQISQQSFRVHTAESVWYCVKCSRKYEKSVNICFICSIKNKQANESIGKDHIKNATTIYTQTEVERANTSSTSKDDEKLKLKEMLKEMKDSLPKRTKLEPQNNKNHSKPHVSPTNNVQDKKEVLPVEAPTLPIGSIIDKTYQSINEPCFSNQPTQTPASKNIPIKIQDRGRSEKVFETKQTSSSDSNVTHTQRKILNTPLKISSLLNPIYIPKLNGLAQDQSLNVSASVKEPIVKIVQTVPADQIYVKAADAVRDILLNTSASSTPVSSSQAVKTKCIKDRNTKTCSTNEQSTSAVVPNNPLDKHKKIVLNNIDKLNHHARRRDLVNQLENSIANGDERAAADAAMKLAQLRLSCSVLSFTSQILQQPLPSASNVPAQNKSTKEWNVPVNDSMQPLPSSSNLVSVQLENKDKIALSTSNQLIQQSKKASKGLDASKSTNNVPIQKCTKISVEGEKTSNGAESAKNNNNQKTGIVTRDLVPNQDKSKPTSACVDVAKSKNKEEAIKQPSTSKEVNKTNEDGDMKTIAVWVEDKEKAHGPINLRIPQAAVVGDLRRHAASSLGLPARLQRWIVGKELCNNDDAKLVSLAGPALDAPFYLCLVECDKDTQEQIRDICEDKSKSVAGITPNKTNGNEKSSDVYTELVKLDRQAAVPNAEAFECEICMEHCASGDGVVLRECVHSFCRQCLSDVIRHCEEPAVSCPAMGCPGLLHEREVRALVTPNEYERWLNRGLAAAESGTRNAFHCRTRDCSGWALCETGARRFPCPVCQHSNCVPCQAIHEGESCEQHRKKLKEAATDIHKPDEGTQALIQSLINKGEALQCPECSAVITKKWGCDWVKCSACKTEICWVTRGRRWGPAGRGDLSGGCLCGLGGKRCHPSCGYCH